MSTKFVMKFATKKSVDLDSIVNGETLNDLVNNITLHKSFSDNLKEKIINGITEKMSLIQSQTKPVKVATYTEKSTNTEENVLVEKV